jgi:hypothetical protein
MRTWTKGTARAVLFTASFVAVGAGATSPFGAYADTTSGHSSILGGNQINAPVSIPINVSGNSVAVIGAANSSSKGGATVSGADGGGSGARRTSGDHSVGGGNQINVPISAPVNVCGNAVAVVGEALAGCEGGAKVKNPGQGYGGGGRTSGRHSILGGNQINAPVSIPVNVCGNAVGNALAGCKGGAAVTPGGAGGSTGGRTSGRHSVGGGNQINIPIKVPVNVCGNAAAVLGDALAGCVGGTGGHGHHGGYGHHGHHGYGHHGGDGYHTVQAPAETMTHGLPTALPYQAKALPLSPGGALPVLPELPATGEPVQPLTQSSARTVPADDPVVPPNLPVQPPALPPLPVQAPKELPKLPMQTERVGDLPGMLPVGDPARLPVQPQGRTAQTTRSEVAPIPPSNLPKLPAGTDITQPQIGGVQDELGPLTRSATGMAPMAADEELLTGGLNTESAYVLAVGSLLAAAAAVMAFTRRIRLGRR